jgi:pimeloyl-ACP methyl ester carboxylesterase
LPYWLKEFDWQKQQHIFNAQPQFLMDVDLSAEANKSGNDILSIPAEGSLRVHFIHKRSADLVAIPLLLLHGWPGSVFEFHKIIDQLTTACPKYKGKSFHVVAPSLPGYLFSEAPKSIGFDVLEIAVTMNALMQQLGNTGYAMQGGDWGSVVTKIMGVITPSTCRAIHVNMLHARVCKFTLSWQVCADLVCVRRTFKFAR